MRALLYGRMVAVMLYTGQHYEAEQWHSAPVVRPDGLQICQPLDTIQGRLWGLGKGLPLPIMF